MAPCGVITPKPRKENTTRKGPYKYAFISDYLHFAVLISTIKCPGITSAAPTDTLRRSSSYSKNRYLMQYMLYENPREQLPLSSHEAAFVDESLLQDLRVLSKQEQHQFLLVGAHTGVQDAQ